MKGGDHGLFQGTATKIAWRDKEAPRNLQSGRQIDQSKFEMGASRIKVQNVALPKPGL